jgi:hypothetical protein
LEQDDATEYKPSAICDAVIALFQIVSYQTTNDGLHGIALVAFDFWYGSAICCIEYAALRRRMEAA